MPQPGLRMRNTLVTFSLIVQSPRTDYSLSLQKFFECVFVFIIYKI